jgi:glutaredoxin 2
MLRSICLFRACLKINTVYKFYVLTSFFKAQRIEFLSETKHYRETMSQNLTIYSISQGWKVVRRCFINP